MVARARTAQSTKAVNDLMSGVSGKGSVDAWERMEEKVEALEAAAEVAEDFNKGYLGPGGSTEEKFKALESKSKVDDELEEMKKMLGGGGVETKAIEGGGEGEDAELERLKREAGL